MQDNVVLIYKFKGHQQWYALHIPLLWCC